MEDSSFKDEEHTRKVINATYLVQEFIDGGNLREQILQQASANRQFRIIRFTMSSASIVSDVDK